MKRLVLEAPCFGYGPISTSVSIANKLAAEYDILFITFGEALAFLKENTSYANVEIDTRMECCFPEVASLIGSDDIVLVNTNMELATFLLERNINVLVVDTLFWMWNEMPDIYRNHKHLVAQVYYGKSVSGFSPPHVCRPIINYTRWQKDKPVETNDVVISFGGMAEPGGHDYLINYACWMIHQIADALSDVQIGTIYVAGGLLSPEMEFGFPENTRILGPVHSEKMAQLIKKSRYVFLSPGLTALYEMICSSKLFCLLPGLNVSQLYQVHDFHKICNYPFCILWPEEQNLIQQFSILPELEGLNLLDDYLTNHFDKQSLCFADIIRSYVESVNQNNFEAIDTLQIRQLFSHPSVESYVVELLEEEQKNES